MNCMNNCKPFPVGMTDKGTKINKHTNIKLLTGN